MQKAQRIHCLQSYPPRLPLSVCKKINVHKRTPDCKNGHNPWLSPTFIIKDQGRTVGKKGKGTGKNGWSYGRRVGAPGRRVGESTVGRLDVRRHFVSPEKGRARPAPEGEASAGGRGGGRGLGRGGRDASLPLLCRRHFGRYSCALSAHFAR